MENATDIKISNIEKSIGNIEDKIKEMSSALTKIAVQKERIDNLTLRVDAAWNKLDNLILPSLQSCPKVQIKWMWGIIIPMGLTLIGIGWRLLSG